MNELLVRPRVADLVFQLYGRPLHPELFDILSVRRVERGDYELRVWITRTGHVITWENEDVLLTELADADQGFSDQRRFLNYRLRGEHSGRFAACNGIVYQTNFVVERLPEEIFLRMHDEIVADGDKRGFLHHFQPSHRLGIGPLGFVVVESRTNCLFVSAFHTFPEESTIVKSQTLIEKQP